jgi:peptide/nickel transport system ATP-binding protein
MARPLSAGKTDQVFSAPTHEYTRMLLEAMPRMDRTGSRRASRHRACAPIDVAPLLEVEDLHVTFPVSGPGGLFGKRVPLRAVDGVSFSLRPGRDAGCCRRKRLRQVHAGARRVAAA